MGGDLRLSLRLRASLSRLVPVDSGDRADRFPLHSTSAARSRSVPPGGRRSSSGVEQLIRNERVAGSNPAFGSGLRVRELRGKSSFGNASRKTARWQSVATFPARRVALGAGLLFDRSRESRRGWDRGLVGDRPRRSMGRPPGRWAASRIPRGAGARSIASGIGLPARKAGGGRGGEGEGETGRWRPDPGGSLRVVRLSGSGEGRRFLGPGFREGSSRHRASSPVGRWRRSTGSPGGGASVAGPWTSSRALRRRRAPPSPSSRRTSGSARSPGSPTRRGRRGPRDSPPSAPSSRGN